MKILKVPYLAVLDVLDLSSISPLMETKAKREYIDNVNWKEEYPYQPVAAFDIVRSATKLYIRYLVRGNSLKALAKFDDSPVYLDSCVEFFMKPVDGDKYFNFEFKCIGTCDAAHRESRDVKESLSREQYASIQRHSTVEKRTFEEKNGVYSWELIVSIPFEVMGLDPQNLPEKILGNFYKCADGTAFPHYLSWSPIDLPAPDFHCPQFFGEIYL